MSAEIPTPEAAPTPEALAVKGLSDTAERIFNEYPSTQTPPQYNVQGFDGVEDVAVDTATLTVLRRKTARDGTVEYQASGDAWMAGDDRGNSENKWQSGSSEVTRDSISETHGVVGSAQVDVEGMGALRGRLEKAFPAKAVAAEHVAGGGLKRLFSRWRN